MVEASFSEDARRECKCENPWDTRLVVLHSRDSLILPRANTFQSFPHLVGINFDEPGYNLSSNKSNKFEQMMCDKSFEFLSRHKKFS